MHRTRCLRALACFALLLTVTACTHAGSSPNDAKASAASSGSSEGKNGSELSLTEAIGKLKVARESRVGYERPSCGSTTTTMAATPARKSSWPRRSRQPRQGKDCKLTGGTWRSHYDDKTVTDAGKLDIDHVVPLAEGWDSGASKWTAERRETYANDLDAQRSLVAVSRGPNRSKGDQDPSEWLPPATDALCTYTTDWVSTKLRWNLNADHAEAKALHKAAKECKDATVTYTPAP
ncbi:HNH endonuclease family protein [Streptomyces sp. NPDC021212]|uniref:HNH endonuclease family protein n=1 Tax=Streptomyces sp. NPDC021212 TaxID=3365118 RepID=UPI00378B9B29